MRTSTRTVSTFFSKLVLAGSIQTGAAFAEVHRSSPEMETMQAMRALAGALLSRQIDEVSAENRGFSPTASWTLASRSPDLVRMPPKSARRTYADLLDLLQPREDIIYLCDVPERDAWGERIEVYYQQENLLAAGGVVTVRSSGANRRIDSDVYEAGGFLPGAEIDDIVIADRRFVRWPLEVREVELDVEPKIGRCPGYDDGSREGATDEQSDEGTAKPKRRID